MMAYPLPLRFYRKGSIAQSAFYFRDSRKIGKDASLCGEVLLAGPGQERLYLNIVDPKVCDGMLEKVGGSASYISSHKNSAALEGFGPRFKKLANKARRSNAESMERLEMHFWEAGTIVGYDFEDLAHDWLSLPITYVKVGEGGLCENGVHYRELKEAYEQRTAPETGRFFSIENYEPYPQSVRLENVGAIFDMVRGFKTPDDISVRAELKKWLIANRATHDRMRFE